MNKVKLTRAQVDALNEALSHYGDAKSLIKINIKMWFNGHEWTGKFAALNELTPYMVRNALRYGFEVIEEWTPSQLDKYGAQFKEDMLEYLDDFSYGERLAAFRVHEEKVQQDVGWKGYKSFSKLTITEMADALGIEMDEQSSSPKPLIQPQCRNTLPEMQFRCTDVHPFDTKPLVDDETHLAPHDYRSMIDIALATNDKAWFDELCSKLKEGATQ